MDRLWAKVAILQSKPAKKNQLVAMTLLNVKTEETAQKQILDVTLARYKAQAAQARLYYEQGSIDAKQLVDAETTATNLSYPAHIELLSKLKQLYADDPAKLQALSAEETKFKLDDLAKSADELASATKKYNEEAAKAVELSQKDMAKEQAADLKVEAATLAYVQSLRTLATAQANLANASGGNLAAAGGSDQSGHGRRP